MRTIEINWSYPMNYDNILEDARMSDIGIYYITREFGGKISDLYIGRTINSFKSRLEDHWQKWLDDYRGKKYVRLGTIVRPKNIQEDDLKQLIIDAESTLIYCCSGEQLLHNKMSTKSCHTSQRLRILNTGWRGNLPTEVYIPDDEWTYD